MTFPPLQDSNESEQLADSQGLVLVDENSLKSEVLESIHLSIHKILKIKKEISEFQKYDSVKFVVWIKENFSSELQKRESLQKRFAFKKRFITEIQEEIHFFRLTPAQAYQKVLIRLTKEGENGDFSEQSFYEDKKNVDYEDYSVTDEDDVLGEEINEFFRKLGSDSSEEMKTPNKKEKKFQNELKIRFHFLASLLHPDKTGKKHSEEEKEIWSEVLEAYKSKDLKTLNSLYHYYKIVKADLNLKNNLSDLKESSKQILYLLKNKRKIRRELSKDPAWKFAGKKGKTLEKKKQKLEIDLKNSIQNLEIKIQDLDLLLKSFAEENGYQNLDFELSEKKLVEMYKDFGFNHF